MTDEQREYNKLIAEFMTDIPAVNEKYAFKQFPNYFEATIAPDCGLCWVSAIHLSYHLSWDWLMPVIDKITSTEAYSEYEDGFIYINPKSICSTHTDVIDFIKWYNENKEEAK